MKFNLKNFPKGIGKTDMQYIADMVVWKVGFQKELIELSQEEFELPNGKKATLKIISFKEILGE